jgi:hypothetical protein
VLRNVKVAVHDYPKRSQFMRGEVTVTADTDEEAMAKAKEAAKLLWPGGKYTPFDVGKPYEPHVNAASLNDLIRADGEGRVDKMKVGDRPVLRAKRP